MLGARRQSVGAVAAKLQGQALIGCRRGSIEVADRPELEKPSCERYSALRRAYGELLGVLVQRRQQAKFMYDIQLLIRVDPVVKLFYSCIESPVADIAHTQKSCSDSHANAPAPIAA
jgi:hypothetical protein